MGDGLNKGPDYQAPTHPRRQTSSIEGPRERAVGDVLLCLMIGLVAALAASASLLNFFEASTALLPATFGIIWIAVSFVLWKSPIQFPRLTPHWHVAAISVAVVLAIPRLAYILEPAFQTSVAAVNYDDSWHIQEIVSMTKSESFPLLSTFDPEKYLRFYYAPWVIPATLNLLGLAVTVKQAIGISHILFSLVFVYSLAYAAAYLFKDNSTRRGFFLIVLLYGGFDFIHWSLTAQGRLQHAEGWAGTLGFGVQFSNSATLALWVPHHTMAAVAIFMGAFLLRSSPHFAPKIIAGMLFASAVFSSPFVVIGAIPLLTAWGLAQQLGSLKKLWIPLLVAAAVTIPLAWILLQTSESGFIIFPNAGFSDPIALMLGASSLPRFMLVLGLEFGPLILAIIYSRRNRLAWATAGLACTYLITTYFIAYTGSNNFALRGSIVPILALIYLATPKLVVWFREPKHLARKGVLALWFGGALLEVASFTAAARTALDTSFLAANTAIYKFNTTGDESSLGQATSELERGRYLVESVDLPWGEPLSGPDLEIIGQGSEFRVTWGRVSDHISFSK